MIKALASFPAGWYLDIKRKKIRHIYFRVYPRENRIGISVPAATSSHALDQAIQAKMPWILKQVCTPRSNQPKIVQGICTGDVCYFKGDPFVLRVMEGDGPAEQTFPCRKNLPSMLGRQVLLHSAGKSYLNGTAASSRQKLFCCWKNGSQRSG